MKYIRLNIDTEGLLNNYLHIYKRNYKDDSLEPVDVADFIVTDTELATASDGKPFMKYSGLKNSTDVTPKQLHNIIFFETLKAFRR